MGDPKKIRKKFKKPMHPWQKARIDMEKELSKKYGLKNKQEIWKMDSILKNFKNQMKILSSQETPQSEKEQKQILDKLVNLGLIKQGGAVDDVLELELVNILARRLQTIVVKKGFARSMKQARQFITHKHVTLGDRKMTSPSYLVTLKEEPLVSFSATSAIHDPEHPERIQAEPSKTRITRKPKVQAKNEKGKEEQTEKDEAKKTPDEKVQDIIDKPAEEVKVEKKEDGEKKPVKPAPSAEKEKKEEKKEDKK